MVSINQLAFLVTLCLTVLFNFLCVSTAYPVDCSKFVFAPTCRGVIAKRININNQGFKENRKTVQSDLPERSETWPEMNSSSASSTYKNLFNKLFPSMVKDTNFPVNNIASGWDKLDSLYQGNDALLLGS